MTSPLDAEIQAVLREIHLEVTGLETSGDQFRNARRLLNSEKERLENNIDPEWLEVDVAKPVKVCKKILVPIYRHPNVGYSLHFIFYKIQFSSSTSSVKFLDRREQLSKRYARPTNVIFTFWDVDPPRIVRRRLSFWHLEIHNTLISVGPFT